MARKLGHKFSVPDHFTQIHKSLMQALWQEIGSDVVDLEGGKAHRDVVVEFVLDAGRLEDLTERNKRMGKVDWSDFRRLPYEHQVFCAKKAFPYTWYTN